jgi:hypothetical protein
MIFSENNYGRLEATALLLHWVAVGAAAMILMTDGAHLIGHGISSLWYVIRPVVVIGGLVWLLPAALASLGEVREIVRYDYSPIPKQLIITLVLLGVALGAVVIITHQICLLPYFEKFSLPWRAVTAPVLSMAVLVAIAVSYAGAAAWFAIFPATSSDRNA